MYPSINELTQDLFGFQLHLPIQTFGLLVGLGFLAAHLVMTRELKRRELAGVLKSIWKTITVGEKASATSYLLNALLGAVIGFKLLEAALHYGEMMEDVQGMLLSGRGNPLGAFIGAAVALYLRWREDKKQRLPQPELREIEIKPYQAMGNLTIIAAVAGMLGAKIFHNLENLSEFETDPWGALLSFGGFTFYGGLICGAAAVFYFGWRDYKLHPLHLADAAAPALMLAYAIGRLGCQLSGDGDWGIVNLAAKPDWIPQFLWASTYPHNVIGEGAAIPGCEGKYCFELTQPVYPTPLYETMMCLVLFAVIWAFRKKLEIKPGSVFALYLILAGIERFLIEKIRVNSILDFAGISFTQAELISVIMVLLGLIWMFLPSRILGKYAPAAVAR